MHLTDLVSVIVPNYNHGKYLKQRLDSIFFQSYKNFEVIILDDCSEDNSLDIIKDYKSHPNLALIDFNKENSGSPFKQWNKAISLARGKYIWIAESDDFCDKNFLATLTKSHQENPEIALAYCQSYRVNSEGEIKGTWLDHTNDLDSIRFKQDFVMDGNEFIEKYLIHKNVIPNVSGVLFNKNSLESILPLRVEPYLKYNADWFYYIQLLCNSKVGFVATPLNYFRYHSGSVIANAGSESGWLKIFKMELTGRREMMSFVKSCNPSNLKEIRQNSRIGDKQLYFLTAKHYLKSRRLIKALQVIIGKPSIIVSLITHYRSNFG